MESTRPPDRSSVEPCSSSQPRAPADADATLLARLVDELTTAVRAGKAPMSKHWREHPHLADELRGLWATIWVAEAVMSPRFPGPAQPIGATADWPSVESVRTRRSCRLALATISFSKSLARVAWASFSEPWSWAEVGSWRSSGCFAAATPHRKR